MDLTNKSFECDPEYSDGECFAGEERGERAPDINIM
jgi:hypothetical protein